MEKQRIHKRIAQLAAAEGITETGLEGVRLFRITQPVERIPAVYSPSICAIVQGAKRAYFNGTLHEYNSDHILCCTMPMPIEAEVPHATPEAPVLGMLLSLDTQIMSETAIELLSVRGAAHNAKRGEGTSGLAVARWNDQFTDAVFRLLDLVGDATALSVLGKGRLREVYYALLMGETGPMIRRAFGAADEIAHTLHFLQENLHTSITIEDLADHAHMSRAVFHRRFKQATTLSPIQFVKSLRLNEASMHIAAGMTINEAASKVGYTSSSQFSREFRRAFGKAPREWGNTVEVHEAA